ncbi:MAG TPA: DNA mismatch repair endonuclease MutL [Terriglobales bacterium]
MGRIRVLSDQVANKIAAGEVVERPASVVKELLENSLDAGATRIRIDIEAGGKKLIAIRDNGCGMVQDDAMLAFERHATSKIHDVDDLLGISTLGFRGEALPSIASVSRLQLETRTPDDAAGTRVEIAGGKLLKVEEAGIPPGTLITVRDLFFNVPARKKFLKAESTELSHIATLVTHYALAHPDKHFELHSATNAILTAAPVKSHSERIYQVFGRETLNQLISVAAESDLERVGLPEPPPWRRDPDYQAPTPGKVRLHGFVSKPELQKLNRNSIFLFVNGRLVRDRLVQHALTEAYRNILPPTVFPVVLLFLELPATEVDANVHPAKTEVRFRQQAFVHDFVRDSVRAALMKARPVPEFTREIVAHPTAGPGLSPSALQGRFPPGVPMAHLEENQILALSPNELPPRTASLEFGGSTSIVANAAVPAAVFSPSAITTAELGIRGFPTDNCAPLLDICDNGQFMETGPQLAGLKPLGQIRESFILAVDHDGLWIVDQHVAHERVLFEKVLKQRNADRVEQQRMLMPMIVELTPGQQTIFAEISDELRRNGFEVELFGSRTIAVKAAPAGIEASDIERMLHELLDQFEREQQTENLEAVQHRIAASIACHAAIKVNTPLEQNKMEWLLRELAKTECPMTCPHGRPVVLRYSLKEIQRAFKRI